MNDNIGAIFDWDGVVIDSSYHHEKSWELLAAENNLVLPPDHFKKGFGMKNEIIIPTILGWTYDRAVIARLSNRKEELYRELMQKEGIVALPGVLTFIDELRGNGIPIAIGSSSHRLNIDMVLRQLNLENIFEGIVCGEDVSEGKPNPEVFFKAASIIQCSPASCVVFEDAPAGIIAAQNAGMKVVGIATTHPAHNLKNANIVVQSLSEMTIFKVKELFRRKN